MNETNQTKKIKTFAERKADHQGRRDYETKMLGFIDEKVTASEKISELCQRRDSSLENTGRDGKSIAELMVHGSSATGGVKEEVERLDKEIQELQVRRHHIDEAIRICRAEIGKIDEQLREEWRNDVHPDFQTDLAQFYECLLAANDLAAKWAGVCRENHEASAWRSDAPRMPTVVNFGTDLRPGRLAHVHKLIEKSHADGNLDVGSDAVAALADAQAAERDALAQEAAELAALERRSAEAEKVAVRAETAGHIRAYVEWGRWHDATKSAVPIESAIMASSNPPSDLDVDVFLSFRGPEYRRFMGLSPAVVNAEILRRRAVNVIRPTRAA